VGIRLWLCLRMGVICGLSPSSTFILIDWNGADGVRCSDPVLGSAILQRRKDFVQTETVKPFIGIFGSNVLQVRTLSP
jgi:hypothetical protein